MRYKLKVYDNDYYSVSGPLDEAIKKYIEENKIKIEREKRDSFLVSRDFEALKLLTTLMDSLGITIRYNFIDYNNQVGRTLLKDLFNIAYTDKNVESSIVDRVKSDLSAKASNLPDVEGYNYPDISLSDEFFLTCLEEIEDKFYLSRARIKLDFGIFYQLVEDKKGNRKTLRNISKLLFIANYASDVSKSYLSFLLHKFSLTKGETKLESKVEEYIRNLEMQELMRSFLSEEKKKKEQDKFESELYQLNKNLRKLIGAAAPVYPVYTPGTGDYYPSSGGVYYPGSEGIYYI